MARPANSIEEDDKMRERLTAAALTLFRESGLDGVSLRKLAAHLGVSHTLLYRYFDNIEGLFTALRLASLQALFELLLAADNSAAIPVQRLRAATHALVAFARANPREYRFLFSAEQPNLAQQRELVALRHRVFDHMVVIAREAKRQGVIATDPRTWVHMAWALLHGLLTLEESNQLLEGRRFDSLVDAALKLLLNPIKQA
jgi:AcrR family transcriptional regulator